MKALHFTIAMWLVASLVAGAQEPANTSKENGASAASSPQKPGTPKGNGPIDVLTDTKGFDLHPYLTEKVLPRIKMNWYNLAPEVARPPIMKKGLVVIQFKLLRDGKVKDLRLQQSSGDVSLDRAAFGGVAGASPLPALPSDYQCQDLTLRFHFYYNPDKSDLGKQQDSPKDALIPCVSTKIHAGDEIALLISPEAANVVVGQAQQFTAALTGATSASVKWSLQGTGCEGSACGTISADGLYTAPAKLPSPATITITARSDFAPDATGSATVTILNSDPKR